MITRPPLASDLVLIGGGHAHVHVIRMLGMSPLRQFALQQGINVTLISRDIQTPYSGMLPGYIAGHYSLDDIHIDLVKLCAFSGVTFIHASAVGITYTSLSSTTSKTIQCDDGRPPIRYDALSIDIGSSPASIPPTNNVIPVKPISKFTARFQQLLDGIQQDSALSSYSIDNPFSIAIIGGGAGGIELACSIQYRIQNRLQELNRPHNVLRVAIVTRGNTILEQHNYRVRMFFQRLLKERNISIFYNTDGTCLQTLLTGKKFIRTNSGESMEFHECLWCTSAGACSWITEQTPFTTTADGFLRVNDTYECIHHPGVFAAGDCCHMDRYPRPKAGVFAVRAGPPLLRNLLNYLLGKRLISHKPQTSFLGLISTGDTYAIASKGNWFASKGKYMWKWKDYIDRKWMAMYKDLPELETMMLKMNINKSTKIPSSVARKGPDVVKAFAADSMRCGGCGAKVGQQILTRVLSALYDHQTKRAARFQLSPPPSVDHDDAAVIQCPEGTTFTIGSIDYFRSFISDPFLFGKVAAVHALSDIHAMGVRAKSALALAVVPFAAEEGITECTLTAMLAGASDVFQDENVAIVGGHTCEGSELACGFSIIGFSPTMETLLRKRGGCVGDMIIVTKPIGTGAVFAAYMRAKMGGKYVAEAMQNMTLSNRLASDIAARTPHVHSCTDVTGFGLIGHLLEMILAETSTPIAARLELNDVPFLEGALQASTHQIYSSLHSENIRNRRAVANHTQVAAMYPKEYPLLFDPQTAGGLLFFVHPNSCRDFVNELREHYPATRVIGEVIAYQKQQEGLNKTIVDAYKHDYINRITVSYNKE
jgi:selenide, water dikinase